MATTIKLQSSDGEIFPVDVEIARKSTTIKTMLEDLGITGEEDDTEAVPLPNVNATILKKVLEWATYHKNDSLPKKDDVEDEDKPKTLSSWDDDFFKAVDQSTVFQVIMAANFLNINGLIKAACLSIALKIKGKNPEEIRQTFNIVNDLPAELNN